MLSEPLVPAPRPDASHDVLRHEPSTLAPFFAPSTVAVVGATETPGSVGRTLLFNLVTNPFGGTVLPINPKRPSVLGVRAYPTVADAPARIDLAVIVTPAHTVPSVVRECVDAGVRAAIVISAGFRELGAQGMELEHAILREARRGPMRVIGPNCLGVMSTTSGLNATFAAAMARPGKLALLSQSGALLTAILDFSLREQIGFSACVSTGSMLDVGWGDLIDYFGGDPRTSAIVVYMESIGDARSFLSAAREVALSKPIIVIKAGRSQAAARAAASHTGALAGSDDVLDSAFRRAGVLRVGHISDLFSMTEVLARQPRPRGPRLTIITNAGGPGVLATDALASHRGDLAELSPETMAKLDAVLPAPWSHANPIDVLGDAGPERYAKTLEIAAADPNSDGLLVVLTPQAMTDATLTAEALRRYAHVDAKPVLASWMGGASVQAGEEILNRAGIPTFPYADMAAHAFCSMWRYTYNLRALYETPMATEVGPVAPDTANELLGNARASGRTLLDEHAAKQVLGAYGIPVVDTRVAASEDEAAVAASAIGFPVVVKLYSHTITHKTDVGGVKLGLKDETAVREAFRAIRESSTRAAGPDAFEGVTVQPLVRVPDAYELIVGSSVDPQFGPVLLFGMGGQLVEVFRDRAIGFPPLNATLARRMMEQTRIWTALTGVRGRRPVDVAALERVLIRLGQLVLDQPRIREIDVNPLLASPDAVLALDARIVLHDGAVADADLPRPVIRPYPAQYAGSWRLADGTELLFRPIRPEDEPLMVRFHQALSEDTVRMRYFHAMQLGARTEHDRLVRVCFNDYDRELALVVEREAHTNGRAREIVAVGRLHKERWRNAGEFAVLVTDAFQRRGIGRELVRRLVDIARRERLAELSADMLSDNRPMQRICQELGFGLSFDGGAGVVHAVKAL